MKDALLKVAEQLRKEAAQIERRKLANTARVTAGMLGLEHFKRILGLQKGEGR